MNTISKMWGIATPAEAKAKIEEQVKEAGITEPKNLEEQALSLVGRDIYEKLVKGYTEKQWGRRATELPSFIIKRLPVRLTYDNNYFNDKYQGIPVGGYTQIIEKMLEGADVRLITDFLSNKESFSAMAHKIVYTGMIDAYYDYSLGELEYRSLRFEDEILDSFKYIMMNSRRILAMCLFVYIIFLIGFMGAGNSTEAGELKDKLEMDRVEMDQMIVENRGMSISEILDEFGEAYFRNLESNTLIELQKRKQTIVSCGGGVVMREENADHMKKNGRVVLLTA